MFRNSSLPFLTSGRQTSGNESSKQIGAHTRTYGGSLSARFCSSALSFSETTLTGGSRLSSGHLPGTSRYTYWSPGTKPAEMPTSFLSVFPMSGMSPPGIVSANGTRWFFP